MPTEYDLADWFAVPGRVAELYKLAAPVADSVQWNMRFLPYAATTAVYWHPITKTAWVTLPKGVAQTKTSRDRWVSALANAEFPESYALHEIPPVNAADWILVKRAAPLGFIGAPIRTAESALGGPTPLTTSIVGGMLTGGLGYGAGAVLEHLFPERYLERGRLRKTLGLLGAGVGAGYGAWRGAANAHIDNSSFWKGMVTPDNAPVAGQGPLNVGSWLEPDLSPRFRESAKIAAANLFGDQEDPGGGAGGLNIESVPVDAFNNAVWNDVRQGLPASQNPFGTKSPWGNNEQRMHTPPYLGAATTGIMSGIQSMYGGPRMLTPGDVVRGIASAGIGLTTANIAGRALSALAGLTPEAQSKLQDMGVFAGIISAVVPPILGL